VEVKSLPEYSRDGCEMNAKIKQLLERQRETNYLLKGLQDKVLLLEDKTKDKKQMTNDMTQANKWHIKNIINKLFKRKGD
jgi:hypothetical protein